MTSPVNSVKLSISPPRNYTWVLNGRPQVCAGNCLYGNWPKQLMSGKRSKIPSGDFHIGGIIKDYETLLAQ